ncbi:BnaC01g20160D [Brassica napus]|uniref:BnaC01g20160D protein n=1 Tax=Brassica napus TaxID=3708 RepID=A0A078G247_BRANA|nr:BnaC01g20160D [Brassica napus]
MDDHLASGSVDPVRRSCSVSLSLPLLLVRSPLVSISPSFVRSVRTSPSQSSSDLR